MLGRLAVWTWLLCTGCAAGGAGVAAAPASDPSVAESGLRVSLSERATSICMFEEGCAGSPKGTVRIQLLEPQMRRAVSEALVAAGFRSVDVEAERDLVADVEWRGTDTIALRLQDTHGRLLDQASYRGS